jgi:DNA-binding PadR family transcriptional regulator
MTEPQDSPQDSPRDDERQESAEQRESTQQHDSAQADPWAAAAEAAAQAASKLAGAAAKVAQEGAKQGMKHGAKYAAKQTVRGDLPNFIFGPPPWAGRGRRGPWGPPPPQGPKARKGDVRAVILTLLAEEPRNGYQIIQEADERTGGAWRPSPGAVYPALQQLADEGLISAEDQGGRKIYQLTEEGRAYVEEHADELRTPWEERGRPSWAGGVGELFKEAAQLGPALMQVVHAGSDEQIAQARKVVADTRRRLYRILAEDEED